MPRLNRDFGHCVFYLYRLDPKNGERKGPCGSGVLVSRAASNGRLRPHVYAVTAYHVAVTHGASIIRINTARRGTFPLEESSRFLTHEPHEWKFVRGGADIAAIDVTDEISDNLLSDALEVDRIRTVEERTFADLNFTLRSQLGPGDDGFMMGLFQRNPGKKHNIPAARFGNISQIATFTDPIEQGHGSEHMSHVFDMHSRPGFSGSPVFVYRVGGSTVGLQQENDSFLRLLGIHSGQFQEEIEATKAEAYGGPMHLMEGDKIIVPSSMAVVVPAWEITELLNSEAFRMQREAREARLTRAGKPKVIPEVAPTAPEPDNPAGKEDFMRLLDAAATKRQPS